MSNEDVNNTKRAFLAAEVALNVIYGRKEFDDVLDSLSPDLHAELADELVEKIEKKLDAYA